MDNKHNIIVTERVSNINNKDSENSSNVAACQLDEADKKRILHKIDHRILSVIAGIYFLQQLDKSTLAYASVFNLQDDTHLHGSQYSWLGSVVYLAQLICQIPVMFILVKLEVKWVVCLVVVAWGIVLMCSAAATTFPGLIASRFCLGALESFIAPALIVITQAWYRRDEQTLRTAVWYSTNGATNMIGSLFTYGIASIPSNLKKYQIIFLFCGAVTLLYCPLIVYYLESGPGRAKFLSKDDDRAVAIERLRANQMGTGDNNTWNSDHVWECLRDIKTWCWVAMILVISIVSGGITTFGPLIIKNFVKDSSSFTTMFWNMPFGAVQLFATIGSALVAQKCKIKGPIIAFLCLPPIAGCVMLLQLPHDSTHQGSLLAGYYLISCYPAITPLIYSWGSQNTAGNTKCKVNNGLMIMGGAIGNIIGPQLYNQADKPLYRPGLKVNLFLLVAEVGIACGTMFVIYYLNCNHRKLRIERGGPAKIFDKSMATVKETMIAQQRQSINSSQSEITTSLSLASSSEEQEMTRRKREAHENGSTDLKNEYFSYVY